MKKTWISFDNIGFYLFVLAGLVLVPTLSGWLGDILRDCLNGKKQGPWDIHLLWFSGVALIFFALFTAFKGKRLIPAKVVEQREKMPPRKAVIALLSSCNMLSKREKGGTTRWYVRLEQGPDNEEIDITDYTLDEFVKDRRRLGSWQQTLRAAAHHGETLEELILIGSKGEKGSGSQLPLAAEFFRHFLPETKVIYGENSGGTILPWTADFENMRELVSLINQVHKFLIANHYRDEDLVIDVTGGQKTASIAAAMVTLNRQNLLFQYVGTGEHIDRVYGFDVKTRPIADNV